MYHLDHLNAFITAAESKSFSDAARKMGKSHSTISAAINNFEISINAQLFDRKHKYPLLTPIGTKIYHQAKLIIRQHERMLGMANSHASHIEEQLIIGIDNMLPVAYIEHELQKLSIDFPHTNIKLVRGLSSHLQHLALSGKLDLIIQINSGAVPASFDFLDLEPISWECVCSPDSTFSDMEVVTSDVMLSSRQIICSSASENPLIQIASKFSNDIWEVSSNEDIVNMVELDLGWAYLPRILIDSYIKNGTLKVFYPDYNPDQLTSVTMIDLLICPNKKDGPVLAEFISLLRNKANKKY